MKGGARTAGDKPNGWSAIGAAAAAGAAVGLVYAIGGAVLSFRYDGFGLSAHAVTVTPREQLLVRGGVALIVWTIVGLLLTAVLWLLTRRQSEQLSRPIRVIGGLGVAAIALVLLLLLHVWWPFFGFVAIIVILTAVRYQMDSVVRFLVCAVAIGGVAIAYEADRLRFEVERTCIQVNKPSGRACGVLIGENGRGFYVGQIGKSGKSVLLFLSARRVRSARTVKQPAEVIPREGTARRQQILSRVIGADVR